MEVLEWLLTVSVLKTADSEFLNGRTKVGALKVSYGCCSVVQRNVLLA